ncbi:endoplasmic oxidoreductin [Tilletiaria anomala UBC 951]|uniref:Endoplasmic oxidoreductin n=1 Tax=Tilletiaria anomala (strain ATCC 24038 / CBS 436.72 / UBC 951) TaxID=1037660 RepID=A0A066VDZ2_TILAU|nr:endoplasmic oxidoreductin [Tilletiaria anomala UBC 951]KDN36974.1 endoplasmic oxidoreductin [Tilletiaria anomala UBC 951]
MGWFLLLAALLLSCVATVLGHQNSAASSVGAGFNPPNFPRAGLLQEVLTSSSSSPSRGGSVDDLQSGSVGICRPTGHIKDAQCDYETVEAINADFFDRLSSIVQQKYFRYYKTDLYKECPFWFDNGLCMNRDCTVQKAEESEIPEKYRTSQLSSVSTTPDSEVHDSGSGQDKCTCHEADFCHWEDENSDEAVYVDLLKNPERFTGYAGPSANRVWKSIYEENCFGAAGAFIEPPRSKQSGGGSGFPHLASSGNSGSGFGVGLSSGSSGSLGSSSDVSSNHPLQSLMSSLQGPTDPGDSEVCLEKRIFYRIVSGLHASISIHICDEYLDQMTGVWGPNLDCFIARIAQHPERLQNVYFNYVLLLRALACVDEHYGDLERLMLPGQEIDDALTRADLASLLQSASNIPTTFNEQSMFAGPNARGLKHEFKQKFRNVSSIMDCVGCDKCRLWGKLQTNGLATALKVLFSIGGTSGSSGDVDRTAAAHQRGDAEHAHPYTAQPALLRSELVALINTVHRFAESLKAVETFRALYQKRLAETAAENGAPASSPASAPHHKQGLDQAPSASDAPAQIPPDDAPRIAGASTETLAPSSSSSANRRPGRHSKVVPRGPALEEAPAEHVRTWLQSIAESMQRFLRTCQASVDQCVRWIKADIQNRFGDEL